MPNPAAEPQLNRASAEQLVGYAFKATAAPTTAPDIKAAGDQFRAGNAETALKMVKGDVLPYSEQDVNKNIINHLSTARDLDGRKTTPTRTEERRRVNDSKEISQVVRSFVENGVITPKLRAVLGNYLVNSNQAFRDIYVANGGDMTAMDPVIDVMLDDPAYKDGLRQLFNTNLDPAKKLTQEESIRTLETELVKLQAQLIGEVTPAQIKQAQDDLDAANLKLAALSPKSLELQTKAERFQELTEAIPSLKREMIKLQPAVNPLLIEMTTLRSELSTLDPTDPADSTRIGDINKRISGIEGDKNYKQYVQRSLIVQEHADLGVDISEIQKDVVPVQQEVERAKESLKELQEKQKTAITPQRKTELDQQIKQKEAQLADAKDDLEAEMIKFTRDITHMPQDAAEAYLTSAFTKLKENWTETAKNTANKEQSDQEALAQIGSEKIPNLWKIHKTEKGVRIMKSDKAKALAFLKDVFKPGGVANLEARIKSLTDSDLNLLGLTPNEIKAFKVKLGDVEYSKTFADSLAKQAMADYFITGGRMSQDMVVALVSSDYGKGLLEQGRARADEIIATAKGQLDKNVLGRMDEIKKQLDEAKNSTLDNLKANWWKYGLAILALLIILGFVVAR